MIRHFKSCCSVVCLLATLLFHRDTLSNSDWRAADTALRTSTTEHFWYCCFSPFGKTVSVSFSTQKIQLKLFLHCVTYCWTNEKFLVCLCLDVQKEMEALTILTLFSEFSFTNTFEKSNIFNLSHEWKMIFLYPLWTSCIFKDVIISLSAP